MKFVKIIDNQGKEIGAISKSYLVPLGLRHQIVRVIVKDETTGEILLQQRSLKDDSCPRMWDSSASGHVDEHETAIEAARRELYEELGIKANINDLVKLSVLDSSEKLKNGVLNRQTIVYLLNADKTKLKVKTDPSEVEKVDWFSLRELKTVSKDLKLTPGVIRALSLV